MNLHTSLGKYELLSPLGSGAYADVYKALDTALKRPVALKVLKPALLADEEAFARFVQEAQVAAGLFHPRIATVLDLGEADGRYFIAMRYIEGQSLDKLLKERGPLPWSEALLLTQQVAEALQFAHDKGLVHRDVKPANIIVSPAEGAVLTDFGLVKAMEASGVSTLSGAFLGTPQYVPPEVWQGQPATPAADQYALACVLAEMLTGKTLFDAPSPWAILQKHAAAPDLPAVWPPDAPPELDATLRRALAQSPGERFASVARWVEQLAQRPLPPASASEPRREARIAPAHMQPTALENAAPRPATQAAPFPFPPVAPALPVIAPSPTPVVQGAPPGLQPTRKFWLAWVGVHSLGLGIISAIFYGLVVGLKLDPMYSGYFGVAVVYGILCGFGVSAVQWLLLRRRIPKPGCWFWISAVGWTLMWLSLYLLPVFNFGY